jgi:hypothetical protein
MREKITLHRFFNVSQNKASLDEVKNKKVDPLAYLFSLN